MTDKEGKTQQELGSNRPVDGFLVVDTSVDNRMAMILPEWLFLSSLQAVKPSLPVSIIFNLSMVHYEFEGFQRIPIEKIDMVLSDVKQQKWIVDVDLLDANVNILEPSEIIAKVLNKCETQGIPALVHCQMGISRSVSVVLFYLIKYHHMDFATALSHVSIQISRQYQSHRILENTLMNDADTTSL